MSVIYLENDCNYIRVISDGILLQGDEISSAEKLFKLNNGIILGFCGDFNINQYIKYRLSRLEECYIKEHNNLKHWYEFFTAIIKEFHETNSISENTLDISSEIIIVVEDKIFTMFVSEDCTRITIYDESKSKRISLGYSEHLMGAVWCGIDPVEALSWIIPKHRCLGFPIKEICGVLKGPYLERNYDKEAFKYDSKTVRKTNYNKDI